MTEALLLREAVMAEKRLQPAFARFADHAQALAAALRALEAVTERFLMPDDCLPADCDQALATLKALSVPADHIVQLLNENGQHTLALALNRYDLLASLRFIETRTVEARTEIECFRLVCQECNLQTMHQRMSIRRRLEMLMNVGGDVLNKVLQLLETFPIPSGPPIRRKRRTV
jgi:hypothetical protein